MENKTPADKSATFFSKRQPINNSDGETQDEGESISRRSSSFSR